MEVWESEKSETRHVASNWNLARSVGKHLRLSNHLTREAPAKPLFGPRLHDGSNGWDARACASWLKRSMPGLGKEIGPRNADANAATSYLKQQTEGGATSRLSGTRLRRHLGMVGVLYYPTLTEIANQELPGPLRCWTVHNAHFTSSASKDDLIQTSLKQRGPYIEHHVFRVLSACTPPREWHKAASAVHRPHRLCRSISKLGSSVRVNHVPTARRWFQVQEGRSHAAHSLQSRCCLRCVFWMTSGHCLARRSNSGHATS